MLCFDTGNVLFFSVKWNLLEIIITRISCNIVSAQLCVACLQLAYMFACLLILFLKKRL